MEQNIKDIISTIGRACKNIREKNNIKQKDFAKRIGKKQDAVSKFERGLNNNLEMYYNYVVIFGCEAVIILEEMAEKEYI